MRIGLSLLGLGWLLACSSSGGGGGGSSSDGGGAGGGGDASKVTSSEDSGSPATDASGVVLPEGSTIETACLEAPFVGFSAALSSLSANGGSTSAQGIKIGFSTCAGFELTTDATGKASTQLTQGTAVTPFYSSSSIVGMLGAEIPATADVTTALVVFEDDVTAAVPGLVQDGGEAAIVEIVLAADPAATGACASTSGVSLAVTVHSEATVSYMAAAWPTDTTVASTTASADGTRAFLGGIQGASKVQVTGTKSGCTVNLVSASQTGNFVLLGGAITVGTATITN